MGVLEQFLFMLAFLALGVGARHVGVLGDDHVRWLTAGAFYVALPALIFSSTYDRPLGKLVSPALVGGYWAVVGVTVLAAWLVHRETGDDSRRSVAIIQSYHGNLGFLGVPLVAATLGGEATAVASVLLGIGVLTQTPITILTLVRSNGVAASVAGELRSVLTNPILLSLAGGVLASIYGVGVPPVVDGGLTAVADLALPLALVCIGGTLDTELPEARLRDAGSVVVLKVVWMPVLAYVVYSALGLEPTVLAAGVLMLGTPTAVATYVYATELGGDVTAASTNVFATTVVSLGTLSVLAWLLG